MKVGLCAWSFTGRHREAGLSPDPHTLEGLLQLARRAGLHSIEGAAGWFEQFDDALLERLRAELAAAQVGVFVDTGGDDYTADLSPLTAAVGVAGRVGSPLVRTTLSRMLEGDRRDLGRDGMRDYLRALVEPLRRAAAAAEAAGVAIGLENHQDLCSHELAWLCAAIGSDHLGVTLDVGNAYAVGETPAAFAARVRPFLKHVHLKDYTVHPTASGYRLKRCALGAGIVDGPAMLAWFDAEAPRVEGCIELGAATARHIRLFEPSWWETYPERPFVPDAVSALGDLHRAARPPETDWRTPHESGASAEACARYELEQFDASVACLRGLGAVAA